MAAVLNKTKAFHFLLEERADLSIKDDHNQHVLHLIAQRGNMELADVNFISHILNHAKKYLYLNIIKL